MSGLAISMEVAKKRNLPALWRVLDHPRAIYLLLACALLLRLVALAVLAGHPLVGDDELYHSFARDLLAGRPLIPLVPPSVGLYLAAVYRVFGVHPMAARIAILPFAIGLLYLLYRLGCEVAGHRKALLLTALFAVMPLNILLSVEPITETPATFLLVAGVLLYLRGEKHRTTANAALLGLLTGLLILTRPSTVLFLPMVVLGMWRRERAWRAALIFTLIPVLMCASWIAYAKARTGHFVMVNYSSTQNVFIGNNPYTPLYRTWWFDSHGNDNSKLPEGYRAMNPKTLTLPWYEQVPRFQHWAASHILARPDLFLLRSFNRVCVYFALDSYTASLILNRYHGGAWRAFLALSVDALLWVVLGASAICLLFARTDPRLSALRAMLAAVIVIYALPYFFSISHPTYHYPILPFVGILAIAAWRQWLGEPRPRLLSSGAWRGRLGWMAVSLAFFLFVQIEYVYFMLRYSTH